MAFGVGQPGPVHEVCRKVNLFCRSERSFGFLVHPPDVGMVDGKEYKAVWIFCSSGSGARSPSFLAILCFNGCSGGLGAFLAFLAVWAVLVQNLFQSSLLFRMKLVISWKAWYETACWRGMFWYEGGVY